MSKNSKNLKPFPKGVSGNPGGRPKGLYCASGLEMTTGWSMFPGAKILYNGGTQGDCVRCTANGLRVGTIRIDGNGSEPRTAFFLEGSYNVFEAIDVSNVISTDRSWVVRSVYNTGKGNIIGELHLRDLVNIGNANDSSPQGYVTDGDADLNYAASITSINIRSLVVNAGTGYNSYGVVNSVEGKDNGFYTVAGTASVDTIIYDGDDNAAGFRHGAIATIGSIHVARSGSTSVFFGNCGDVSIGHIFIAKHNQQPILHLNNAAAGHIRIGSIKGSLLNTAILAMPSTSGTVESLTINSMDVECRFTTAPSQTSFDVRACKSVTFGRINIKYILEDVTTSGFIYAYLNPTLTYLSVVDSFRAGVYEADGVTPHATRRFFGQNFTQQNVRLAEATLNGSAYLAGIDQGNFHPGRLIAGQIPTAGTWPKGVMIWAQSPSASFRGWVCTVAGTPGTWVTF
ncbi:hypothetical protein [Pseudochrobactrum asaccharolyticum]|uniref:hypothetical protein n=1 Tax=Pseudochrobactrum asaccharolyticum TaxID=354351 RepID=UPI0040413001